MDQEEQPSLALLVEIPDTQKIGSHSSKRTLTYFRTRTDGHIPSSTTILSRGLRRAGKGGPSGHCTLGNVVYAAFCTARHWSATSTSWALIPTGSSVRRGPRSTAKWPQLPPFPS